MIALGGYINVSYANDELTITNNSGVTLYLSVLAPTSVNAQIIRKSESITVNMSYPYVAYVHQTTGAYCFIYRKNSTAAPLTYKMDTTADNFIALIAAPSGNDSPVRALIYKDENNIHVDYVGTTKPEVTT